jgi:hypothetical protein
VATMTNSPKGGRSTSVPSAPSLQLGRGGKNALGWGELVGSGRRQGVDLDLYLRCRPALFPFLFDTCVLNGNLQGPRPFSS